MQSRHGLEWLGIHWLAPVGFGREPAVYLKTRSTFRQQRVARRPITPQHLSTPQIITALHLAMPASRPDVIGPGSVVVAPSSIEGAGNGLFAERHYKVGAIITEYCGTRITFGEAKLKRAKGQASHIR